MSELAVKENQLQEIATQTNVVLQQNISSADKAVEYGRSIISKIESQGGLNDELDKECNAYLVKVKRTLELMNERRKPITQLFDQIKKHFTEEESKLDPKRSEVYLRVQKYRDMYAKAKAEEREKKEAEARRKLEAAKERTSVIEQMSYQLSRDFYRYMDRVFDRIAQIFDSVTLENYFDRATELSGISKEYPRKEFDSFTHDLRAVYLSREELEQVRSEVLSDETFKKFADEFSKGVEDLKQDYLEKLPSKKQELEEIAKAEKEDAEKAEQLKKQAEKRQAEERERAQKETAEREKAAKEEAARKKAESDMTSLFDATKDMAVAEQGGQVRKSLLINIKHPAAFVQIFQVWFEEEGTKLPVDKLEKKTLGQMKRFCEGLASKDGVIIDSPYIEYVEDFKAVAK